ncbi:MAG TPA: aminoglycoside phosphotransferase family protein [Chloroflexia bacterium]
MTEIPENFARTMGEVYGEEGRAWLERLPDLLAACARRWRLTVGPPFVPLSYNYVAPATQADGTSVVLKVGYPGRELRTEIAALQLYDGHGIAQLLDADAAAGALLLERLLPGTPLAQLADDAAATTIAAQVMRQLWRPVPPDHPFPTVADWAAGLGRLRARFGGTTGPLPAPMVDQAERLFADLLGSMDTPVLLHGDLHHDNILMAQRQPWLALDPKGLVGEAAYETGALLRNPAGRVLKAPDPHAMMARRIDQLAAELGFERERIRAWALAQAVLSAWWSIEDHGYGWEDAIAYAEILDGLRH